MKWMVLNCECGFRFRPRVLLSYEDKGHDMDKGKPHR